jgi:hypothetical protein
LVVLSVLLQCRTGCSSPGWIIKELCLYCSIRGLCSLWESEGCTVKRCESLESRTCNLEVWSFCPIIHFLKSGSRRPFLKMAFWNKRSLLKLIILQCIVGHRCILVPEAGQAQRASLLAAIFMARYWQSPAGRPVTA